MYAEYLVRIIAVHSMILLFCLPSKWLLIVTVYLLGTGYWLCTLFFFILSIVLVDNIIGS